MEHLGKLNKYGTRIRDVDGNLWFVKSLESAGGMKGEAAFLCSPMNENGVVMPASDPSYRTVLFPISRVDVSQ